MKHAITALLLIGLLAIPIGCILAICPMDHDCCPKAGSSLSTCPYDILSSAKAAPDQHFAVAPAMVDITAPFASSQPADSVLVASVLIDQRGLHLENRVLRR